jgi:hypothetical protein
MGKFAIAADIWLVLLVEIDLLISSGFQVAGDKRYFNGE